MQLSGQQSQQVTKAILEGYPTRASLRMMVHFQRNPELEAIAGGADRREVIFNLVAWIDQGSRTGALMSGTSNGNPGDHTHDNSVECNSTPDLSPSNQ